MSVSRRVLSSLVRSTENDDLMDNIEVEEEFKSPLSLQLNRFSFVDESQKAVNLYGPFSSASVHRKLQNCMYVFSD